jgi:REP element-mobilizing transposase RayT
MQDELLKGKYKRKSIRLEGFDYGSDGAYYVTVCSHSKKRIFSEIVNGAVSLLPIGKIIEEELQITNRLRHYVTIIEWIIMPDHIHLILFIHKDSKEPEHLAPSGTHLHFPEGYKNEFSPQRENLASVIRGIKSAVTTRVKIAGLETQVWQSRFYERIVRNQKELRKFVRYIRNNPHNW